MPDATTAKTKTRNRGVTKKPEALINTDRAPTSSRADISQGAEAVKDSGQEPEAVRDPAEEQAFEAARDTELAPAPSRLGQAARFAPRIVRGEKHRSGEGQVAGARVAEEQCRRLGESILFASDAPARMLGFTSAVAGEGRTLLAAICADALARSSGYPVALLEWDWDHPSFDTLFGVPAQPGLAEWLQGAAEASDVRHQIAPNLTVIPAGNGAHLAARLLRQLREPGTFEHLLDPDELIVIDLPPVLTCAYGKLAATVAGAAVMVVRAGVTPDSQVAQACSELGDTVRGVLLNQVHSNIPHWLRSIL